MHSNLFSESCRVPKTKANRMCNNTAGEETEQERDSRSERELWDVVGGSLFDLIKKYGSFL